MKKDAFMGKQTNSLFAEARKEAIADAVDQYGRIRVADLCQMFNVSPATIRNDLRELENIGSIRRTHGGALALNKSRDEMNSYEKQVHNMAQKQAIAREALKYIQPGDSIALDTGTTTFELAKLLDSIQDLTVITNDLQIASYLEQNTEAQIHLAGGSVRRHFHYTTGQTVLNFLSSIHVDKIFAAANGISNNFMLSTPNLDISDIKARLLTIGEELFVLADSSKIGKISFAYFGSLSEGDVLITDDGAAEAFVAKAEAGGIQVVTAKGNE